MKLKELYLKEIIFLFLMFFSFPSKASVVLYYPAVFIKTKNWNVVESCVQYSIRQCRLFGMMNYTGLTGVSCSFRLFLMDKKTSQFFSKEEHAIKLKALVKNKEYQYFSVYAKDVEHPLFKKKKSFPVPLYQFFKKIPYIEETIICTSPEFKTNKEEELSRIIKMLSSKEDLARWEALQLLYRFSYASSALLLALQKMKKHEKLLPFKAYATFLLKRAKYHLQTKRNRWKNIQFLLRHPDPWNRWEGMQRLLIDSSFDKKRVIQTLQTFYKREKERYTYFQKESYRYPYKTKKSLFYRRLRSQSEELLTFSSRLQTFESRYLHHLLDSRRLEKY